MKIANISEFKDCVIIESELSVYLKRELSISKFQNQSMCPSDNYTIQSLTSDKHSKPFR